MGLEAGTRIQDLVPTNPVGATDFANQGDDHIRLLKVCIQGSLPNLGATAVALTADQINNAALKAAANTFDLLQTFSLGAVISAGGLTVTAGGIAVTAGGLVVTAGGLTVTAGAVAFPAASIADAALSANVPLKNAANVFTASQSITSATAALLQMAGSGTAANAAAYLGEDATGFYVWQRRNALIQFGTNDIARLTISAAGNVSVSAPDSGTSFTVNVAAGGGATSQVWTDGTIAAFMTHSGGLLQFGTSSNHPVVIYCNNAEVTRFGASGGQTLGAATGGNQGAGTINVSGAVYENGNPYAYRDLLFRLFSSNDSTAAADRGCAVEYQGAGGHTFTLDADMVANGTVIVVNGGSGNLSLAASGGTLYWYGGAGSLPTGTRTVAIGGVVFCRRSGSGNWSVWGSGIS